MSEAFTLGVIGHVDHGKTALVRALTGIETDRLAEERRRGLSIELGFAFIDTPGGTVDLIDVPGHENFVRTMIGGATGLDGVVLCVAANEGLMPQTVEHFDIARLLGLTRGIVVVTKTDLVGPEALERVHAQIGEFVHGTFLEGAPVIDVAAVAGMGVDAVRQSIADCRRGALRNDGDDSFLLPLDRVFTMRGFGVVVTGTLRGGGLRVGDRVEIMPTRRRATVRGLQNHRQSIGQAQAGQRVAVNLRHVNRADVRRGDVLTPPGAIVPATRIDASLRLLGNARAVRNGDTVRLLTGTTEAMARLRLLDRQSLAPGEEAIAQFTLDREVATRPREPYLVRTVSPVDTIGGGTFLTVNPERHRRYDSGVAERLRVRASGDVAEIVAQRLRELGVRGLRLESLVSELAIDGDALRQGAAEAGAVRIGEDLFVDRTALKELKSAIVEAVDRFHAASPLRSGLDLGALASEWLGERNPDPAIIRHAIGSCERSGVLRLRGHTVSRAGYDAFARLPDSERELVAVIEQKFRGRGIEAMEPDGVVGTSRKRQIIFRLLVESGRLVRLRTYDRASRLVLHSASLDEAVRAIRREFPPPASFAPKDVRDLLDSTRKYVVPLMEHLDASGVTVRSGDMRRLRDNGSEEVKEVW